MSVIITSHNNAECLRRNLPSFLMQAYDNFEVIVVDECSEDDTAEGLTNSKAMPHSVIWIRKVHNQGKHMNVIR